MKFSKLLEQFEGGSAVEICFCGTRSVGGANGTMDAFIEE
jgi:hypothetical protein